MKPRISIFLLTAVLLGSLPAYAQPRNVVFILSDDHRYDFMGFHERSPEFLETPNMDRMAAGGMHIKNAFVTTSLCSPSRGSILTGQYAYKHGVVDNSRRIRSDAVFFPQYMQEAGYETAYVGKWHMGGDTDEPRPGFDYWVSFRGQGTYYNPKLNINGEKVGRTGYMTDILTEYAVDWLDQQPDDQPFMLYLSHKAVHAEFMPAPRHLDRYKDAELKYPPTYAYTETNYQNKPRWVKEQRNGWHGVDYMYHGQMDFDTFYRRYCESLLALDESIGKVLDTLEEKGLSDNTLVVYMGDNGFSFGEHGLIDKRHAYEESMRVPMLAYAPGHIEAGSTIEDMILNIDIGPTFMDLAGMDTPTHMDGRSFLPLLTGTSINDWRKEFVYQYFWEYNFPHTPTVYALRGQQYKYMFYHGLWDKNEFYDLQNDPFEQHNLINSPAHKAEKDAMKERLFDLLTEAGAVNVQFQRPRYNQQDERFLRN